MKRFLERDTTFNIIDDPAISLGIDLIVAYYDMNHAVVEASEKIERDERLFNAAVRRMYADRNFYPMLIPPCALVLVQSADILLLTGLPSVINDSKRHFRESKGTRRRY